MAISALVDEQRVEVQFAEASYKQARAQADADKSAYRCKSNPGAAADRAAAASLSTRRPKKAEERNGAFDWTATQPGIFN